jgi:hypothetical protein
VPGRAHGSGSDDEEQHVQQRGCQPLVAQVLAHQASAPVEREDEREPVDDEEGNDRDPERRRPATGRPAVACQHQSTPEQSGAGKRGGRRQLGQHHIVLERRHDDDGDDDGEQY